MAEELVQILLPVTLQLALQTEAVVEVVLIEMEPEIVGLQVDLV